MKQSVPDSANRKWIGSFEVIYETLSVPRLPESLAGATMVQLSDLHRGCGNTDALIAEAVSVANNMSPEFIVVTGDFVDEHKKDVLPAVDLVKPLRAKYGVHAVLGNHDQRGDPELLLDALSKSGINVVHNRAAEVVDGFWVVGIDDILEGHADMNAAFRHLPPGSAAVFLAHNPNSLDLVPMEYDFPMLSGHTHGGQIALSFPSPKLICKVHLQTSYVHGWFRRGKTDLYVNRGIGVTGWGPMARRVNCPSEITVFTLQRATPDDPDREVG